jgi:PAS domain S-box-containing protein
MKATLRALVVEDSPTDYTLLLRELGRDGRQVHSTRVEDKAAITAALSQEEWDVVISDWSLPSFSALETIQCLARSGKDIPLIILSGTVGDDVAVEAMRAGAQDFMSKDNVARLLPAIDREVKQAQARAMSKRAADSLKEQDGRFQEELRAASLYARSLLEASPDPFVTIDPAGKITDLNEGSIKVTGVPRTRLIGTDFCDYFTEPGRARDVYHQVFAKGAVTDYPLTILHQDGLRTDVLYNASVYKDAAGRVLGVFAVARDVTAQKKAEAELTLQRSKESERLVELERLQKVTVGRELKMIELKKEIEDLRKLAQG